MSVKYLYYFVYSHLTRGVTVFWSIFFVLFWLAMGAYVFGNQIPEEVKMLPLEVYKEAVLGYTSGWYALSGLISFSAAAVSLVYSYLRSSASVAYVTRFTRLSSKKLTAYNILGSSVFMTILAVVLLLSTYAMFSHSFGSNLAPYSPALVILVGLASGVFFYALSLTLANIMLSTRLIKGLNMISFLPLVLAFLLGYGQTFVNLGYWIVHLSPYNNIMNLLAYAYVGREIPIVYAAPPSETVNLTISTVSLIAWITLLSIIAQATSRWVKFRRIEELMD